MTTEKTNGAHAHGTAAGSKNGHVELSDNARVVLEKRYLRKNDHGSIVETPEGMFRRVANAIARAELDYGGRRHPDGLGFAAFGRVVAGFSTFEAILKRAEATEYLTRRIRIIRARMI